MIKKLLFAIVVGLVLLIIGGVLQAYSSYYLNSFYSSYPSCYQLHPYTYNNLTQTYNYSTAYLTCEVNSTKIENQDSLNSSLLQTPGWILEFVGAVTLTLSIALLLIAFYKDRNQPSSKPKK